MRRRRSSPVARDLLTSASRAANVLGINALQRGTGRYGRPTHRLKRSHRLDFRQFFMDNDEYPRAVSQCKMLCWTSSSSGGQPFAVNAPVVQPGVLGPRDGYRSFRKAAPLLRAVM